jgi:hypothetical protein
MEAVHKQDMKRMKHEIRRMKAGSPPRKTIFDSGGGSSDGPTRAAAAAALEENEQLKVENASLKDKIEQLVVMLEEAPRSGNTANLAEFSMGNMENMFSRVSLSLLGNSALFSRTGDGGGGGGPRPLEKMPTISTGKEWTEQIGSPVTP